MNHAVSLALKKTLETPSVGGERGTPNATPAFVTTH